jgi:hypothetical protein
MPKKNQSDKNINKLIINCKSSINSTITDISIPENEIFEEKIDWYSDKEYLSTIKIKKSENVMSTYNLLCKALFYKDDIFLIFNEKTINILTIDEMSFKNKKEINISSTKYDGFQLYTTHLVLFYNDNIVSIINIKL